MTEFAFAEDPADAEDDVAAADPFEGAATLEDAAPEGALTGAEEVVEVVEAVDEEATDEESADEEEACIPLSTFEG